VQIIITRSKRGQYALIVNAVVQAGLRERRAVLQIKNNKSLFLKDFIEDALLGMPGGVHIVLMGTHQEIPLVALGYRYSTKITHFFCFHKGCKFNDQGFTV